MGVEQNYESGGQEFESLRARQKPFGLVRPARKRVESIGHLPLGLSSLESTADSLGRESAVRSWSGEGGWGSTGLA